MARSTALTEPAIKRLAKAPAGKRVEKFDRLAPGLCLRVSDKGRKYWIAHYRLDGKLQKLSLGEWPGLPVDKAREEMRKVRDEAKAGIDPKAARERERAEAKAQAEVEAEALRTFGTVAEEYIKRDLPRLKRGREIEAVIRNRLLPEWRDKPLVSFRKRDAIRLTDELVDEGHHGAALKLHEVIRRVFSWAAGRDELEASPFASLRPPVGKEPRQRALSHPEIRILWRVCDGEGFPWGSMLKLLLLTGQRRGEVAGMRWSELDDPENPTVWTIPAERSKSARQHRVPLSAPARAILASLPRINHPETEKPEFVFTTNGRTATSGFSKTADRIRAAVEKVAKAEGVEVGTDFRWHDLRRTMRTELARIGVDERTAEKILNHAGDGLSRVYNVHSYEREKAAALDRWADELLVIVGERKAPAKVVPIGGAR